MPALALKTQPMKRLLIFLFIGCASAQAQHFTGVLVGKYSGILGAGVNPALTAASPYIWHVNLVGVWGNVHNDYLKLRMPYPVYRFIGNRIPAPYVDEKGNPTWSNSWLKERLNGNPKNVGIGAMVKGPSVLVKVDKNWKLGVVSDATALGRVSGVYEPLAHALRNELDTAKGAYDLFDLRRRSNTETISRLTVHGMGYAAAGIHASRRIKLKWGNYLDAGINLKKVWGLGGFAFASQALKITKVNDDSVQLDGTDMRYYEFNSNGRGEALELGVLYTLQKPEFRQPGGYKYRHPDYLLRAGLALMDVGRIRYNNVAYTQWLNTSTVGWNLKAAEDRYKNQQPGLDLAEQVFRDLPGMQQGRSNIAVGLPTRLVLHADYQYTRDFFLQAQVVQSLRGRHSMSMRHPSYMMLAPRYTRSWLEVSTPLFLEYDYKQFRAALALRVGPVYLGTNSLFSMLSGKRMRDADFYIGIAFGNLPGSRFSRASKEAEDKQIRVKKECGSM
ncbi:MAG: hypothetical protein RL160_1512 [Bacteroidota bacterium]